MTDVVMPQMGESIVEGTLTRWAKKVGDKVERDEPLFEISTDKVDTEIPSPAAGTLSEILVQEGATVGINTIVGRIDDGAGAWQRRRSRNPLRLPSSPLRKLLRLRRPRLQLLQRQAPAPQLPLRKLLLRKRLRQVLILQRQLRKRPRKRKMKPDRCRRWFVRWRASTTSTCRRCAAPASVAESPSRMSKPTWLRKGRAR